MVNNWLKTSILLASLTALMLVIGNALGGQDGVVLALILATLTNFIAYWFSDSIILTLYGAKEIKFEDEPILYNQVALLVEIAKLPMPRLYIINNKIPNAFATGRDPENSSIAVTSGLLSSLNQNEISAVLAHELSHIKHRDTLIATIAATIAGAIGMLANWARWAMFLGHSDDNRRTRANGIHTFIMIILSPIIAALIQMAISRSREFAADNEGGKICNNPEWLASALLKLDHMAAKSIFYQAENNPATAHLFIVSPLQSTAVFNLFSTHPSVEERVKRLRAMAINVQKLS